MKYRRATVLGIVIVLAAFFLGLMSVDSATAYESKLNTIAKKGQLRVGWANWFPYIHIDPKTNKISGFTVDFYEEMARVLNVKLVWVEDKWATLVAGMAADKYDMICNANKSLSRLLAAEYGGPIARTDMRYLVRKADVGPGKKFETWKDVDKKGVRLGLAMGTTADKKLTDTIKQAEIVRLQGDPEVILSIRTKKVDVYATDEMTLILLEKEYPELTILPGVWSSSEMGLYVPQGDQILLNWVNWFIWDMKREGKIEGWLEKYEIKGVSVVPTP
ncbi:MAG: ABC transporter substrate-binding protein [Proteobacteria bacterium]|nr:ABC transporter substrate-binding protein [Pseudomonadota bacterium]